MNTNIRLHIVAFNVPYPANYGGVIDVFHKIKALSEIGAKIILHCFEYGRGNQPELDKYCEKVFYYKRKKGFAFALRKLPYIVGTRNSEELLSNLRSIKAPILFEGLHTCYHLNHPQLQAHLKAVRMHNVEHEYYSELGNAEKNIFKRIHFKIESQKLKSFEKEVVNNSNLLFPISPSDQQYFNSINSNSHLLHAFHNQPGVTSKAGKGSYVLFHGNLSVAENFKAVLYLINKVFNDLNTPFIIAGKNPPDILKKALKKHDHIKLIANPAQFKMDELIQEAHINLIPTFQATGMKLKLIGSLFAGRFCLVNSTMIKDTGLKNLCIIADSSSEMKKAIIDLFKREYTVEDIQKKRIILESEFSNINQAKRLIQLININNTI